MLKYILLKVDGRKYKAKRLVILRVGDNKVFYAEVSNKGYYNSYGEAGIEDYTSHFIHNGKFDSEKYDSYIKSLHDKGFKEVDCIYNL